MTQLCLQEVTASFFYCCSVSQEDLLNVVPLEVLPRAAAPWGCSTWEAGAQPSEPGWDGTSSHSPALLLHISKKQLRPFLRTFGDWHSHLQ